MDSSLRTCLLDPIPELYEAARLLDEAVTAHLAGDYARADRLIRAADLPVITEWSESLWGPGGPFSRPLPVANPLPTLPREQRVQQRMPGIAVLRQLIERDGFHCRFCGIPVIRARYDFVPLGTPSLEAWLEAFPGRPVTTR